ncbi:hypothetical protein TVAG_453530 [Trichomonas vaginalis G3]|uniref:Uncharacterized protein n=1 Tax=Trichomonas vaginalis (strain ATCC PRA-98 / G3) TaxID=412133 RepID=A2DPS9_TRIV3|nr:hypothetical protein TVAGG3_0551910 [Trichomonas vaginalis G3]EAY17525.1 hypothetical protein TVAG_453530 [Trichomonas vaginalis G3]KAI5520569.1 hypothetical protein TVAGG3_0551910 [Trichomonas vaginalis G3]|eukprot:XP_001329660.1 hypothetical protein [Trichomonas vaginalis G3]
MPKYTCSIDFAHNLSTWRFSINQDIYLRSDLNIKYFNGSLNCNHCNFTVRNSKSNSTPRDLILAGSTKKVENINLFLRTLRHTGCKCTVAFLVDNEAYKTLTSEMIKDIELCGGQIINMGIPEFNMRFNYFYLIYLWDYYVVKRNYHRFDRIMKCDMFDTLFQGDPFNDAFKPGKFYMIEEMKPFHNQLQIYDYIFYDLGLKQGSLATVVCAGISFGYTQPFTRALDTFFSYFVWDKGWHDQHLFNVLFMSGLFMKNGVSLVRYRIFETVRHMYEFRKDDEIGYITGIYNNKIYAQVVHHVHVAPKLLGSMLKYCPNNNSELLNYVTKFRPDNLTAT